MYLRKRLAIEEEDYDSAKAIKAEIARVRVSGVPKPVDEIAIRADATGAAVASSFAFQLPSDAAAASPDAMPGETGDSPYIQSQYSIYVRLHCHTAMPVYVTLFFESKPFISISILQLRPRLEA